MPWSSSTPESLTIIVVAAAIGIAANINGKKRPPTLSEPLNSASLFGINEIKKSKTIETSRIKIFAYL